jgi:hypothetical protein
MFNIILPAISSVLLLQSKLIQAEFEWDRQNKWVNRGEGGRFTKSGETAIAEKPQLISPPARPAAPSALAKPPVKKEAPLPPSKSQQNIAKPIKKEAGVVSINEHHILKGDVVDGKLAGGMHTKKALDAFCDEHGHSYETLRTNFRNGVREVELPLSAMKPLANGGVPEPRKTLFPDNWADDDIVKAIKEVIEKNPIKTVGNREMVEGIVKGVLIRVGMRYGRVVTAFPKML